MGVLAALIATLAPVDSPVPLGPLEGLTGSAPAEAQSAITQGRPNACPAPLQPNGSLCELGQPACPAHPYQTGAYLDPSTEFPDFCEATVWLSDGFTVWDDCTNTLRGYVTKSVTQGSDSGCRMIRPTQCAPNMHRTRLDWCRQVQRRGWSCPAGTTPTNRFNQCYREPAAYPGRHPACVTGAPSFAISSCEDYVSQDFERAPALVPCNGFDTGGSPRLYNASSPHWCQFYSQYLDVSCHGANPPCATAAASCVKRASTTGGCNAIADTLRCRDLQADFRDGNVTADYVYLRGCTPCLVLPFSPPNPAECPRDLHADPTPSTDGNLELIHQRRRDTGSSASSRSLCTDPPRGRLEWESSHHAGFAIVNSPVVLRVVDIPVTARRLEYVSVSTGSPPDYKVRFLAHTGEHAREYFEYADRTSGDTIIRSWASFDPGLRYASVDKIVGAWKPSDTSSVVFNSGPCLVRRLPDFRVRVEELWPDGHESEIRALFGSDALSWWPADKAEQRRRTEARGLTYVGDMNATDRANQLARRADDLTQEVRCNYSTDVWCSWQPARPGYYRLVAAGAWYMHKISVSRRWLDPALIARINNTLSDMYAHRDGDCSPTPGDRSHADYDCLKADLDDIARRSTPPLTYADAGLESDLSVLIPVTQNAEWLYTLSAGPNVRCPPRDMRLDCIGGSESSNYTETEPIGILVHEVRVSTVTPDR